MSRWISINAVSFLTCYLSSAATEASSSDEAEESCWSGHVGTLQGLLPLCRKQKVRMFVFWTVETVLTTETGPSCCQYTKNVLHWSLKKDYMFGPDLYLGPNQTSDLSAEQESPQKRQMRCSKALIFLIFPLFHLKNKNNCYLIYLWLLPTRWNDPPLKQESAYSSSRMDVYHPKLC